MLSTPEIASAIIGMRVMPTLLKIAASRLYSKIAGTPIR